MSTVQKSALEEAIRKSGENWLIDWYEPKDQALSHLRKTLGQVHQLAQERLLSGDPPNLSEEAIVEEYARNPQKVRAFFQALGGTRTPVMLLMVWRIIQGMEVKRLTLSYERQQTFEVCIVLQSPYGGEDEPYISSNIHDFALLRRIGVHEVSGLPVFDGFYALKVR